MVKVAFKDTGFSTFYYCVINFGFLTHLFLLNSKHT